MRALQIGRTAHHIPFGRTQGSLCLLDGGALRFNLQYQTRDGGLLGRKPCLARRQRQLIIAVINFHEHIALLDHLIVRHFDLGHIARHFGGQNRHIRPHIGVIGCHHETAMQQPRPELPDQGQTYGTEQAQQNLAFLTGRRLWGRLRRRFTLQLVIRHISHHIPFRRTAFQNDARYQDLRPTQRLKTQKGSSAGRNRLV